MEYKYTCMQQFEGVFGLVLGRNLLQHADSLSVCLQRKSLSAAEGQVLAIFKSTIRTLKNMRADDKFALFWKYVTTLAEHNLVNAPGLPRRRRLPEHDMKMETPLLDSMKHRTPDTDTVTLKPLTS